MTKFEISLKKELKNAEKYDVFHCYFCPLERLQGKFQQLKRTFIREMLLGALLEISDHFSNSDCKKLEILFAENLKQQEKDNSKNIYYLMRGERK